MPIAGKGETGTPYSDPSQVRSLGEDAVPAPGHNVGAVPADYRTIPGWNIDADKASRGFVPGELPSNVTTVRGEVKHWQVVRGKIHVSNEQPGLTPVFGEAQPPHGASGKLRDYAYEFGEAANRHWLTLMAADRVERMGSLAGGVLRGHPDNIIAEKAWLAEARYEREGSRTAASLLTAVGLFAGVLAGAAILKKIR